MLRQKILKKCREDIYAWLNHENGQIAIYDAVNPLAAGRRSLAKEFAKYDVQVSLEHDIIVTVCLLITNDFTEYWTWRPDRPYVLTMTRHSSWSRMLQIREFSLKMLEV